MARFASSARDRRTYARGPSNRKEVRRIEIMPAGIDGDVTVAPVRAWAELALSAAARDGVTHGVVPGYGLFVAGGGTGPSAYSVANRLWTGTAWTSGAAMPVNQTYAASGVLGTKLYGAGGYAGSGVPQSLLRIYNAVTNTWSTGASMPATRVQPAGATEWNTLFAIGGSGPVATNYMYDPVSNAWGSGAALPAGRSVGSALGLGDGTVLFVGGYDGSAAKSEAWRYDIAANTWTAVAPIPSARFGAAIGRFPVDGLVLVCGGWNLTTYLTTAYLYDPVADAWEATDPHAYTHYQGGFGVMDDGGFVVAEGSSARTERYGE